MKSNNIYFLGIGGIGMSALAQYFLSEGKNVYGYDHTPSPITQMLTDKGAIIHYDINVEKIPASVDFVVWTPAIHDDNLEYQYFVNHDIPIYKRSQVLGQICDTMPSITVAGTHGKTTTTSMVCHLLASTKPIAGFIGGIAKNFNDNLVLCEHPEFAVAEADEFDRSFLTLHPSVAIITSMDADHLDIYGTHENLIAAFRQYASQSKILIIEETIADKIEHPNKLVYGRSEQADYYAANIILEPNKATFDLITPKTQLRGLQLKANGIYNVLNATAAMAAIEQLLASDLSEFASSLLSYAGVKRRFDYITEREDFIYIDDYAHHPEEMRSFVTAVKKIYPGKQICGIFQPHLYTRTRDFAKEFAEVLSLLDKVILLPIYPAREKPIPGIDSEYLLSLISQPDKLLLQKEELLPYLSEHRPDVLLTIGAGDIDRFVDKIRMQL